MKKIKILFYAHTIDYAGTWRSHERIALNLNKDFFDVYIIYREEANNNRLNYVLDNFDTSKLIKFNAPMNKTGPNLGYSFIENNFFEVLKDYSFDIVHFARGGYYEWPFIKRFAPIQIETNIFGSRDNSEFLDYSVTICNTINNLRGGSDKIIYNAIPHRLPSFENMKKELNLSDETLVLGRIGRPDNFSPISIMSAKLLKDHNINFKYIIIGACENAKRFIENLGLSENFIILETTSDDNIIHKFYNTIDIFAHYRSDGECHSTAIAQAMSYGIPIISHFAGYNGQQETIKDGGFVVNNDKEYYEKIILLKNNKEMYEMISKNSYNRFLDFELTKIVKEWENVYINLYKQKNKI